MSDRKIEALPLPEMLRATGDAAGSVLKAQDMVKSFGGFRAVDGVSIDVQDRSLHALIGPNGAGKTTAFNLLSGMLTPDSGQVTLSGHEVAGLSADRIAGLGMGRSFQITSLFPDLSVQENVRLAIQAGDPARMNPWTSAAGITRINDKAREIIAWVGLAGMEEAKAGSLSYGGQRLLDLRDRLWQWRWHGDCRGAGARRVCRCGDRPGQRRCGGICASRRAGLYCARRRHAAGHRSALRHRMAGYCAGQ